MPKRDDLHGPPGPTRRRVLAGLAALGLAPSVRPAARSRIAIGFVDSTGIDEDDLARQGRALFGRPVEVSPFRSWASLRDHFDAPGGDIDAAVLPAGEPGVRQPLPALRFRGPAEAALVACRGPSTLPRCIARSLARPHLDVALLGACADLGWPAERLVLHEIPPASLLDNVRAGLVDAALLTGAQATAALDRAAEVGVFCRLLDPATAAALRPPLRVAVPGLFSDA